MATVLVPVGTPLIVGGMLWAAIPALLLLAAWAPMQSRLVDQAVLSSPEGRALPAFDMQREIAVRLGYTSHPGMQDVERFMKHYFLIAKDVGDLTAIMCSKLEDQQTKPAPILSRMMAKLRPRGRRPYPRRRWPRCPLTPPGAPPVGPPGWRGAGRP